MIRRLINWLKGDAKPDHGRREPQRRRVSVNAALHARSAPRPVPVQQPQFRDLGNRFEGRIENTGPGKNVLVSDVGDNDHTGSRETLRLFDSSPLDPNEPVGIDPYNSGEFDRSRHWDTRFRN